MARSAAPNLDVKSGPSISDLPRIIDHDVPRPPTYADDNIVSEAIRRAARLEVCGIQNPFDSLTGRQYYIYCNTSAGLLEPTKLAMETVALFLLRLGQASNADMKFHFTSMTNTESTKQNEDKEASAEALRKLFLTKSWDNARDLISESAPLQKLGMDEWIPKNTSDDIDDDLKHHKLLDHVRTTMNAYWWGWPRETTVEKFRELYKAAVEEAAKQKKSLNSPRFAIDKAINLRKNIIDNKQTFPVTVIILTATALEPTEVNAIKARLRENVQVGEGEGSQFCISMMLLTDRMPEAAIKLYKDMDNYRSGDNDFIDIVQESENSILRTFISPQTIVKLLNGNNREVDKMQLEKAAASHRGYLANIDMPSVERIRDILGR